MRCSLLSPTPLEHCKFALCQYLHGPYFCERFSERIILNQPQREARFCIESSRDLTSIVGTNSLIIAHLETVEDRRYVNITKTVFVAAEIITTH